MEQRIPREGRTRGGGPSCRSGKAGLSGVITLGLSESQVRVYILCTDCPRGGYTLEASISVLHAISVHTSSAAFTYLQWHQNEPRVPQRRATSPLIVQVRYDHRAPPTRKAFSAPTPSFLNSPRPACRTMPSSFSSGWSISAARSPPHAPAHPIILPFPFPPNHPSPCPFPFPPPPPGILIYG